jgi:glycosyltransferase involved in cell wall biosynthesis
MKAAHLTSVHSAFDIRIFQKECKSLAENNIETHIVAQGEESLRKKGVHIHSVEEEEGKYSRIFQVCPHVYRKARNLDADIYHIHDPELLPIGLILKYRGKSVLYDSHELFPETLKIRRYVPNTVKNVLSIAADKIEIEFAKRLDGVIAATPTIKKRFEAEGIPSCSVLNYPNIGEFEDVAKKSRYESRPLDVAYVGSITEVRGIYNMVEISNEISKKYNFSLNIAGSFSSSILEKKVTNLSGWKNVDYRGWVGRSGVKNIFSSSRAGLLLFHPAPNNRRALPIKLFEYMSAGLPVVASDFPLWRKIIEEAKCGILVDPLSTKSIVEAITWLFEHPEEAKRMGSRGRQTIEQKYNWNSQVDKLISFYENTISRNRLHK